MTMRSFATTARQLGDDAAIDLCRWHHRAQLAQFGALFTGVFTVVTAAEGWHAAGWALLVAFTGAALGAVVREHAAAGALRADNRALRDAAPEQLAPLPAPMAVTPTVRVPFPPPAL